MNRYYYCEECSGAILREFTTKTSYCLKANKSVKLILITEEMYEIIELLKKYMKV